MASFGVTSTGYVKKTLAQIKSERETAYKAAFGSDIDMSPYSPFGLIIGIESKREFDLYEKLEEAYYNQWIDTAERVSLDRAVAIRGISRIPATQSIVTLTFDGTNGILVPVGTICQTTQAVQFITTKSGVISSGTVDVTARAIETGLSGNVAAGTITTINTVVTGVDGVTNSSNATGGREIETDVELRQRYKLPNSTGGSSAPAIQAVLRSLDGILNARVFENNTDSTVGSLTPHSIRAVVEGATSDQIFETFLHYKPCGIQTIGAETATGLDNEGVTREYNYDEPSDVDIYVDIDFTIDTAAYGNTASAWRSEYLDQINTNVIEIVGGNIGGVDYPGRGIAEDIEAWRIIANQTNLPYVQGQIVVKVAGTVSPTSDRVDIANDERGKTEVPKITVTAT